MSMLCLFRSGVFRREYSDIRLDHFLEIPEGKRVGNKRNSPTVPAIFILPVLIIKSTELQQDTQTSWTDIQGLPKIQARGAVPSLVSQSSRPWILSPESYLWRNHRASIYTRDVDQARQQKEGTVCRRNYDCRFRYLQRCVVHKLQRKLVAGQLLRGW